MLFLVNVFLLGQLGRSVHGAESFFENCMGKRARFSYPPLLFQPVATSYVCLLGADLAIESQLRNNVQSQVKQSKPKTTRLDKTKSYLHRGSSLGLELDQVLPLIPVAREMDISNRNLMGTNSLAWLVFLTRCRILQGRGHGLSRERMNE